MVYDQQLLKLICQFQKKILVLLLVIVFIVSYHVYRYIDIFVKIIRLRIMNNQFN